MFAKQVDYPWNSARIKKRRLSSFRRKNQFVRSASRAQTLPDAIARLLQRQRCGPATYPHALLNLPQFRASELVLELRLSRKNYLEQFAPHRLQIKQQANLFQRVRRKPLSFVDNQHRGAPGPVKFQQPSVQPCERAVPLSLARDVKIRKHQFEQLADLEMRIHN